MVVFPCGKSSDFGDFGCCCGDFGDSDFGDIHRHDTNADATQKYHHGEDNDHEIHLHTLLLFGG